MFKFLILSTALIAFAESSIIPDDLERVAGGFNAGKLKPKCFTTLHISFPNSDVNRKCGGCLIGANKVITSGNCVTNPQDGTATIIKFSFGGANNKGTKGFGVSKVALAPGYDYTVRNSSNDLAIVTLTKSVKLTPQIQTAVPDSNNTLDAFVGQKLLICGYGYTNDKNKNPPSLKCAYMFAVSASVCTSESTTIDSITTTDGTTESTTDTESTTESTTDTEATTDDTTTTEASGSNGPIICAEGDGKSNVCHGDEGSPVFVQISDSWTLIGVVSSFPNSMTNTCLDNHNAQITQLGGFTSFISSAGGL